MSTPNRREIERKIRQNEKEISRLQLRRNQHVADCKKVKTKADIVSKVDEVLEWWWSLTDEDRNNLSRSTSYVGAGVGGRSEPFLKRIVRGLISVSFRLGMTTKEQPSSSGPLAAQLNEIKEWAARDESKRQDEKAAPSVPILTVDLDRMTITLNKRSFDVSSRQALRWVKVLAKNPGAWISSTELKKEDPELDGCRPDRHCRPFLPGDVLALIESNRKKGSRLRLP